jgi:hypothetical protein
MSDAPDRPVGDVLVGSFVSFVAGYVAAFVLALLVFGVWRRNAGASDENLLENAAMAGYMLFVTAVPAAAGFALVTSPWRSWRSLPTRLRVWLGVGGGVAAYVAQATGIATLLLFIPLPGGFGAIGAGFRIILPGLVAGLAVLALVSLLRRAQRSG